MGLQQLVSLLLVVEHLLHHLEPRRFQLSVFSGHRPGSVALGGLRGVEVVGAC